MDKSKLVLDGIVAKHTEKLKYWYDLLCEIMPDYFFQTFTPSEIQEILPLLFNLDSNAGVEQIIKGNKIILVHLRNAGSPVAGTARLLRDYNVSGAVIHESKQKLVVDGVPHTLVIEFYTTATDAPLANPEPTFSKKEVLAAFKRAHKAPEAVVGELYGRINWHAVKDLTLDRLVERLACALDIQDKDWVDASVEKAGKHELRLTFSRANLGGRNLHFNMVDTLWRHGFHIQRAYYRELTLKKDDHDFGRMPVTVNTVYLGADQAGLPPVGSKRVQNLLWDLSHINWVPMDDLAHRELVEAKGWSLADANFIRAAAGFIHSQLSFVNRDAYHELDITRWLALHEPLARAALDCFKQRFDPAGRKAAVVEAAVAKRVQAINTGMRERDEQVKTVLHALLSFVANIRKTNFFIPQKTSLAFRLDPAFMRFYEGLSKNYAKAFPADRPYGVFYFFGEGRVGFHVRFAKIARGGWRTVIPNVKGHELEKMDGYEFAKDELFREVYVLAHTQHLKNKDIYEGGSKLVTLLNVARRQREAFLHESQRSICCAFLDLITCDAKGELRDARVVDALGEQEIIELGPDENMFDLMLSWISSRAERVGYVLGTGFMSGKPDCGINHKEHGVTSYGVHQYLLKTLAELGVDPAKDAFSVKLAGGPLGDVAGNEFKLLLAKDADGKPRYPALRVVAVTDGPAAAFDPEGLDPAELARLTLVRDLAAFSPEKLRGEGAYIVFGEPVSDNGVEKHRLVRRHGGKLHEALVVRDEFMGLFQGNLMVNYADVFIPCGGRPGTIDVSNAELYACGGAPSSKAIVEGANSFITPGARDILQEKGVWIIKDASANKCGVMTSSYEIIGGLLLGPAEFLRQRAELVKGIFEILGASARQEAEWLFSRFRRGEGMLTELTERLSRQVNGKNEEISAFLDSHPELVRPDIIKRHLPGVLRRVDDKTLDLLPAEYKKAIVAVELAKTIVYSQTGNIQDEIAAVLGKVG